MKIDLEKPMGANFWEPYEASKHIILLRENLPTNVTRPAKSWLYGVARKAHEPTTDPMAQAVVTSWQSDSEPLRLTALTPGAAGFASYKVEGRGDTYHLKVPMAAREGRVRSQAEAEKLRREGVAEALRAQWAGSAAGGFAPRVVHVDRERGAFVSHFVSGTVPALPEIQGPCLPAYLQALATLHATDITGMPPPGPSNWLYKEKAVTNLANADKPQSRDLQAAVLQVESGIERILQRSAATKVAIHDDVHPGNTLFDGERTTLLDWNNLHEGDAGCDIGHLAVMVDIPMAKMGEVIAKYRSTLPGGSLQSATAVDQQRLASAYTAFFRLRNYTFYDQKGATKELADYTRQQLAQDVTILREDLFAELDLRPSAALTC